MDPGINTRVEPWDFVTNPNPGRLYFICPYCGRTQEQHVGNFHWWCVVEEGGCGRNASDLDEGPA